MTWTGRFGISLSKTLYCILNTVPEKVAPIHFSLMLKQHHPNYKLILLDHCGIDFECNRLMHQRLKTSQHTIKKTTVPTCNYSSNDRKQNYLSSGNIRRKQQANSEGRVKRYVKQWENSCLLSQPGWQGTEPQLARWRTAFSDDLITK